MCGSSRPAALIGARSYFLCFVASVARQNGCTLCHSDLIFIFPAARSRRPVLVPPSCCELLLIRSLFGFYEKNLSLALAYSGGVSECIFHSVPNIVRNFYTVSAWPGHERNLMVPHLATHGRC
jgi:hypothetical protein